MTSDVGGRDAAAEAARGIGVRDLADDRRRLHRDALATGVVLAFVLTDVALAVTLAPRGPVEIAVLIGTAVLLIASFAPVVLDQWRAGFIDERRQLVRRALPKPDRTTADAMIAGRHPVDPEVLPTLRGMASETIDDASRTHGTAVMWLLISVCLLFAKSSWNPWWSAVLLAAMALHLGGLARWWTRRVRALRFLERVGATG